MVRGPQVRICPTARPESRAGTKNCKGEDMTPIVGPWRVQDELIEQPSWGGRYIIDVKGLSNDPKWFGKKVGQSYELAKASTLIDPSTGELRTLAAVVGADPAAFLG